MNFQVTKITKKELISFCKGLETLGETCVRAKMSAIFFQIQDQSRTLVPKGGIFETN